MDFGVLEKHDTALDNALFLIKKKYHIFFISPWKPFVLWYGIHKMAHAQGISDGYPQLFPWRNKKTIYHKTILCRAMESVFHKNLALKSYLYSFDSESAWKTQ